MTRRWFPLFVLCITLAGGGGQAMGQPSDEIRSVLVGASIGKGWQVDKLPERTGIQGYRLDYSGAFEFNKSSAVRRVLSQTPRPHAVIVKECAAYFPVEIADASRSVAAWVEEIRSAGVVPVLATVVPVRRPPFWSVAGLKDLIKRLVRPAGTVEATLGSITAYNDWVRRYAAEQGLSVLDLEAALRVSGTDRSLDPALDSGDGLHINQLGYARLDRLMVAFLQDNQLRPGR